MAEQVERPPDGPYGPGWSDDPGHYRGVDWGASADRPPRPKTSRNVAVFVGLIGTLSLLAMIPGWLNGDFEWHQVMLPASQLALSATFFYNYKQLLKRRPADDGS